MIMYKIRFHGLPEYSEFSDRPVNYYRYQETLSNLIAFNDFFLEKMVEYFFAYRIDKTPEEVRLVSKWLPKTAIDLPPFLKNTFVSLLNNKKNILPKYPDLPID